MISTSMIVAAMTSQVPPRCKPSSVMFTQPRCAERRRFGLRLRLLRQVPKQFIDSHHRLPRIHIARESHCITLRLDLLAEPPKKSHALSRAGPAWHGG
jgi:hypothetical protein